MLAAFCDPAIEAVKEVSAVPIFTLEEPSFSVALLLGNKFGILAEKKHKESVKRQHVRKYGLDSRFLGVPILDPIIVTYKVAVALTEAGIRHSKIGLYAVPAPKKIK